MHQCKFLNDLVPVLKLAATRKKRWSGRERERERNKYWLHSNYNYIMTCFHGRKQSIGGFCILSLMSSRYLNWLGHEFSWLKHKLFLPITIDVIRVGENYSEMRIMILIQKDQFNDNVTQTHTLKNNDTKANARIAIFFFSLAKRVTEILSMKKRCRSSDSHSFIGLILIIEYWINLLQ